MGEAAPTTGTPAPYVSLRSDPYRAHALTLRYCGPNKRVLEIGCSTGYLSEAMGQQGCRVTGVEIDPVAAEAAKRYCERVLVGDIETLHPSVLGSGYEVLMLADVLEHLRDPVAALKRLAPLLAPGGYTVISVPNVGNWGMRLGLLAGRWDYTERGILDRTHLRFFTLRTIVRAVRDAGYSIRQLDASSPVPFNPPFLISRLAHAVGRLRPSFFAYQFIIVAVPAPNQS
jgi:2-polyprenyl-3-methyl-5-hydroxy-6-metoxy-1,4-benzoquinol methylase